MVFTQEEKNGVRDLAPADAKRRDDALNLYKTCGLLAQQVCHDADAKRDKFVWWEGPVGRGAGSPFAIVGQESHSSMFDMDFFLDLMGLLDLQPVYVDQGAAGAESPKTTAIYGTPNIIKHFDKLLGALPLATPTGDARTVGFDERGSSKAKALAKYPLEFRARLACGMLRCALQRPPAPLTTIAPAPLTKAPEEWFPPARPPAPPQVPVVIAADDDLEPPMTVQARGGGHRPALVDTVPRFEIDSESKER